MRLFVALDIDEAIQQRLDDYVRTLLPRFPGVRFVRSSNYHVTLQVSRRGAQGGGGARTAAPGSCCRLSSSRFAASASFPTHARPRIFWAGIEAPALSALARSVGQSLEALGFAQESDFHPHLTLARNGSGRPRPVRGERPAPTHLHSLPGMWLRVRPRSSVQ